MLVAFNKPAARIHFQPLTFYRVCAKRGSLLANVVGIVVHDHWKPYY
jgi:hypothetical protein